MKNNAKPQSFKGLHRFRYLLNDELVVAVLVCHCTFDHRMLSIGTGA